MSTYCDNSGCNAQPVWDRGDSVPGVNGAFRAIELGDIGSPGYLANPPPRILEIRPAIPWSVLDVVSMSTKHISSRIR
jgi:hypothetical protein